MASVTVGSVGESLYRSARLAPDVPVRGGATELLIQIVGRGVLMRQPRASQEGTVATIDGRRRIVLRAGMSPARTNFWVGAMLATLALEGETWFRLMPATERDVFARAVGAWVVAPPAAVRAQIALVGYDLASLARAFAITQTCSALRVQEAGVVAAVAVVTPERVHRRGPSLAWLGDDDARALAGRKTLRTLRKAPIRDEPGRVALLARAG